MVRKQYKGTEKIHSQSINGIDHPTEARINAMHVQLLALAVLVLCTALQAGTILHHMQYL